MQVLKAFPACLLAESAGLEPAKRNSLDGLANHSDTVTATLRITLSLPAVKVGFHNLHVREHGPLSWRKK